MIHTTSMPLITPTLFLLPLLSFQFTTLHLYSTRPIPNHQINLSKPSSIRNTQYTNPPVNLRCVNCVWDLYREDLEHYTSQKRLAEQQLHHLQPKPLPSLQTPGDSSIGEDRGDVFRINDESEWLDNKDIPMGIRVFMAMEKQLKARKKDMI